MFTVIRVLLIVIGVQILGACSNAEVYNSMQGAREQECQHIVDAAQRNQCLDSAHMSHDRYEQQRNESRKQ